MAFVEQSHLYEVFLRFGPEGLTGAHQRDLVRIVDPDSGVTIAEREGAPAPITAEAAGSVVGAQVGSLVAQNAALVARVVELEALASALAEENAAIIALQAKIEAAAAAQIAAAQVETAHV